MKWIPIAKAKPKFNQDYLVATATSAYFTQLESIEVAQDGKSYNFGLPDEEDVTHIAAVSNPNGPVVKKEEEEEE